MTTTTSKALAAGDIVRYARPAAGEEALTFTVIEMRGDRCLIESRDFQGVRFMPTEVVATDELAKVR